jgi:hypothetical protein
LKNNNTNSSISTNSSSLNKGNTLKADNTTNNSTPSFPALVENAPYKPIDCTQTVILKAQRLLNDYDYANKKEAFFTMNAFRINIFDQKSPDSFVNSIGLKGLNKTVDVLKGSKNCLFFSDINDRHLNLSMCIDDKNTTNQILHAYEFYLECSRNDVVKTLSEQDSLEKILNDINNPNQVIYKIPKFRKALINSLTMKGVFYFI